jgi:hypothetical protein
MKIRPRYSTVLTLTALLILGSGAQLGTIVVCAGSDGHLDIELLSCACCALPTSTDGGVRAETTIENAACTGCIDVPMRVPSVGSRAHQLSNLQFHTERHDAAPGPAESLSGGPLFAGSRMDQHGQTLSALSTVIILT